MKASNSFVSGVPFLPWESEIFSSQLSALYVAEAFLDISRSPCALFRSIMSTPVIQLKTVEKVEKIYRILRAESHHGFPVVDHRSDETSCERAGTFQGIILRHQLITILRKRVRESKVYASPSSIISL
jgi:CBS domain-containing protein